MKQELPSHLGGHGNITHIDEGALIYLKRTFGVKSMIDVGCGKGGMLELASRHHIIPIGVDGDFVVKRSKHINNMIILHDYAEDKVQIHANFDLAWSVEFLEHVDEKYLDNVFHTLKKCRYVFCTASPVRNKYHLNPQPVEYWIKKFEDEGFDFLKQETKEIRVISTMNRNFVRDTGMVFKNKNL